MAAVKFERTKMEILGPLVEPGVAALGIEERAGVLFREKSHFRGNGVGRETFRY